MMKNFVSKSLSQGGIEQDYLLKQWKIQVFGVFNKNINFSTESTDKPKIYDLLFLIAIYSSKNDNKYPSEIRNWLQNSLFTTRIFVPGLELISTTDLKCWLIAKFFQKFIFAYKLAYKKQKSVNREVIDSIFRRQWFINELGAQICAPPVWIRFREFETS